MSSLKQGLSGIAPDFPDIETTFFAALRQEWKSISVDNGAIVASSEPLREKWVRSARGKDSIDGGYDAYVVYALGISAWRALTQKAILQELPYDSDEMANVIYLGLQSTSGLLAVSALRKITRRPVLMVAAPHMPERFSAPLQTFSPEALLHLVAQFHAACVRLAGEFGVTFVAQPKWTVSPDGATTQMKFWSGKEGDKAHMNADYGAAIARPILTSLCQALSVRTDADAGPARR